MTTLIDKIEEFKKNNKEIIDDSKLFDLNELQTLKNEYPIPQRDTLGRSYYINNFQNSFK